MTIHYMIKKKKTSLDMIYPMIFNLNYPKLSQIIPNYPMIYPISYPMISPMFRMSTKKAPYRCPASRDDLGRLESLVRFAAQIWLVIHDETTDE